MCVCVHTHVYIYIYTCIYNVCVYVIFGRSPMREYICFVQVSTGGVGFVW